MVRSAAQAWSWQRRWLGPSCRQRRPVNGTLILSPPAKLTWLLTALFIGMINLHAAALRALIVDGQNNHDYTSTTPHLKKVIEETGLFSVEIATAPGKGADKSGFKPEFRNYRVIISNYN